MKKSGKANIIYDIFLRILFFRWHQMTVWQRRKRLRFFNALTPLSKENLVEGFDRFKVPAKKITTRSMVQGTILYLHGGAYVLGMTKNHINLCSKIAHLVGMEIIAPHYRLAPEDPFPSALNDVVSVYSDLLLQKGKTSPLFIGGDSAGGGLALALLQEIREREFPMPDGAFLFSPWTDLTLSSNSVIEKARVDPILSSYGLREDARAYAGNLPLDSPRISPLFASLHGFPPILIQVGTQEILLDDARSFAEKARMAGIDVVLSEWEGMFHVVQTFPMLDATDAAIKEVAAFIARHKSYTSRERD